LSQQKKTSAELWEIWEPVRNRGDVHLCRRLLINGHSPNFKGGHYERTPLHLAARGGHFEICKLLLEYRAKVDEVDNCGDTAFALAAVSGHEDVCRLLAIGGACIDHEGEVGDSLLLRAARQKRSGVCRFLLEPRSLPGCREIRLPPADVDRPSTSGETALGAAVDSNAVEVCKVLLGAGANPNFRAGKSDAGERQHLTPFERSFKNCNLEIAQVLNSKRQCDPFRLTACGATLEELVMECLVDGVLDPDSQAMIEYVNSLRTEWAVDHALPATGVSGPSRIKDAGML
jgi:ankyrin repeat protein